MAAIDPTTGDWTVTPPQDGWGESTAFDAYVQSDLSTSSFAANVPLIHGTTKGKLFILNNFLSKMTRSTSTENIDNAFSYRRIGFEEPSNLEVLTVTEEAIAQSIPYQQLSHPQWSIYTFDSSVRVKWMSIDEQYALAQAGTIPAKMLYPFRFLWNRSNATEGRLSTITRGYNSRSFENVVEDMFSGGFEYGVGEVASVFAISNKSIDPTLTVVSILPAWESPIVLANVAGLEQRRTFGFIYPTKRPK